jgi:hypothetical protein
MNESVVAIKDFDLTVKLSRGAAEFPADPNDPDGVQGSVELLPVVAKKEVVQSDGVTPRKTTYVFGIAIVNAGGSGSFAYLLMYIDDGKNIGQVSSAALGDRVVIQGMKVGDMFDDGVNGFTVAVRILGRNDGDAGGSAPEVSKVLTFRVKKDSEVLTPDATANPIIPYVPGNIPPPPPHTGD